MKQYKRIILDKEREKNYTIHVKKLQSLYSSNVKLKETSHEQKHDFYCQNRLNSQKYN